MLKLKALFTALLALLAVCVFVPSAQAQVGMSAYQYTATASGCVATFLYRQTNDGGIAASGSYSTWIKLTDTCGLAPSNTANFAAFGFCTVGQHHTASPCSGGGLVEREIYTYANCSNSLLSQTDGAAATGVPQAACVGSPIYSY